MTPQKKRWIEYMLGVMRPSTGLIEACRAMLEERYDAAWRDGYDVGRGAEDT